MRIARRPRTLLVALASSIALLVSPALALDPPHDASRAIDCASCHITHHAPGGSITRIGGNANLCFSCHAAGGVAAATPFVSSDQAIPGESGSSHRWDSGAAGWARAGLGNTSSGKILSTGTYTGRYRKTWTLTVTSSGDVGAATFDWKSSAPVRKTFLDSFPAIAFNGSSGTQDWSASPWVENGEANGAATGLVRVATNAACASGSCLVVGGGLITGFGATRSANLQPGTSAMLTFQYRRALSACPKTSTASVAVEASSNGVAWTTLATYMLNACDTAQVSQAFDVTTFVSATTSIRLRGTGTAAATDFLYMDNVQLEFVTSGGGASGVPLAASVLLDDGVSVSFLNGAPAPSFVAGNTWTVQASPEVNQPASFALSARLADGKVTCSTCHNQHSQMAEPFDPDAPAYPASGTGGEGRHNQRLDNNLDQVCVQCHSARNVVNAQSSHPVAVAIPATGAYKHP